jgi:hypothetical protein
MLGLWHGNPAGCNASVCHGSCVGQSTKANVF